MKENINENEIKNEDKTESVSFKVRAPWFQDGWQDKIQNWIKESTASIGIKRNGNAEQVKSSDLSFVQLIPSDIGPLYFKAVVKSAAYETKLSKHMGEVSRGKSAEIISIEENEGLILMRDIKGKPLREVKDKPLWQRAIEEYSMLQVQETENVDALITMGVPDRRMGVLKKEIDKHLEGMCATGLDEAKTSKIMALKPELLKMCETMKDIIPASIEHGDLHSANIRLVGNDLVFFDWGDAAVTHPFFSTRVFWNSLYELIEDECQWLSIVKEFRHHYLEPWTKYATMEELEKMLILSEQLSCVYRALSWYLYINPNRENQEESYNRPAQWLQVLLEHRELLGLS